MTAADNMKKFPQYTGEKFWEKWDETKIPSIDDVRKPLKLDTYSYI